MSKQTAITWLKERVEAMIANGGDLGEDLPALMRHIDQAKEIERQNIIDAYCQGRQEGDFNEYSECEQYYTQTFKD